MLFMWLIHTGDRGVEGFVTERRFRDLTSDVARLGQIIMRLATATRLCNAQFTLLIHIISLEIP